MCCPNEHGRNTFQMVKLNALNRTLTVFLTKQYGASLRTSELCESEFHMDSSAAQRSWSYPEKRKESIFTIVHNVKNQPTVLSLMSDQGCHYRWLLATRDSWWTRSPSRGAWLLNDNLHQWNALRETARCLLNQESLLMQPVRRWHKSEPLKSALFK